MALVRLGATMDSSRSVHCYESDNSAQCPSLLDERIWHCHGKLHARLSRMLKPIETGQHAHSARSEERDLLSDPPRRAYPESRRQL